MIYEWFKHIDFAYPYLLGLLILLPLLVWWYSKKTMPARQLSGCLPSMRLLSPPGKINSGICLLFSACLHWLVSYWHWHVRNKEAMNKEKKEKELILCFVWM